ncbi:MAG TPA: amidohydrolase family protein [Burkholderiaceae bacterium]|nr:amidohydrolase family protein [Burkholderiaceae bacterium]
MSTRRNFHRAALSATICGLANPLSGCTAMAPTTRPLAVDCHAHVFLRSLPMPDRRRAPSGYDAPPEAFLAHLDEFGLTHGVVVQPSFLGTDNAYLLDALQRYPKRLRGVAVVDPSVPAAELDRLQQAGVVGIRLNQVGLPAPEFGSPAWQALLRELQRRAWHVQVHQVAAQLRPLLDPLLERQLDVVVDHFGRPDPTLGVEDPGFRYLLSLAPSRRVWVKLSASYRNGADGRGEQVAREALPLLAGSLGWDRLVWGSDWPHTLFEQAADYGGQRRRLDAWIPEESIRRRVLGDNAAALYRIGAVG